MVNLTNTLHLALLLSQLASVVYGVENGVHDGRSLGNNMERNEWSHDGHIIGNEDPEETIAHLLKMNPWAFYLNREPPTFARESRNPTSFQQRVGRDEEVHFTETSRSPPFAPRLGRVLHYSPRFRRITMN